MIEIWRDIKDYEGLYQVSNLGRVKNSRTGKLLHPSISKCGYMVVDLYKEGLSKQCLIHRLVAEAFVSNPDNLPTVDHINRIKTDNRVENLRWAPWKLQAKNRDNRNRESQKDSCSKPVCQYTKDMMFVAEYPSIIDTSRQTGVNRWNIISCCKGKCKSAGGYVWKYKD